MPSKSLIMPKPTEKQDVALRSVKRYVGYGGARGGGKSWFVRWKAILLCMNYPGIKILITRKTYRELLNNHILPLQGILGAWYFSISIRSGKFHSYFSFVNTSYHF